MKSPGRQSHEVRGLVAGPTTSISPETMLVLAGTPEQLRQYDAWVGTADKVSAPVLILGGGRVGQAIARALARRNIAHCIVVAVQTAGQMQINPEPSMALPAHADVILIGTAEAEQQLLHAWS